MDCCGCTLSDADRDEMTGEDESLASPAHMGREFNKKKKKNKKEISSYFYFHLNI